MDWDALKLNPGMLVGDATGAEVRLDVALAPDGAVTLANGFETELEAAAPGSVQANETVGRAVGTTVTGKPSIAHDET